MFLPATGGSERVFTFAAAGDFGMGPNAAQTFKRLGASNASLFLAVGDFSYAGSNSETTWCNLVKSGVGDRFPFEVLAGNHEDNGPDGLIENYAQCLPNRIDGLQGTYGKEYYFDYPTVDPFARFILISPNLAFPVGGTYSYKVGTSHYRWLIGAIDSARLAGIPWVVVGMHEFCLSTGGGSCDVSQDLFDLLTAKKVDLVLQGHAHNYQRTKQISCAIRTVFLSECVTGGLGPNTYVKGAGTVVVISGTGGRTLDSVKLTDTENPYFAAAMGATTSGAGYGYVAYTVTPTQMYAKTAFSGSFSDSFSIVTAPLPDRNLPSPSSEPPVTFAATGNLGSTTNTDATLNRIAGAGTDFTLALGDFSYAGSGSEPSWCNFVTSHMGATHPFELVSGDHEDNGPDGLVDNFTACLPDRIGSLTGTYGKQYYFDYPSTDPLARFILISPALSFTYGGSFSYKVGSSNFAWLISAIDGARSSGIPWVIVGMHKVCLSVGSSSCDVGQDLLDLLAFKRVDLILESHDASYQRTKQLTCAPRTIFVPSCVSLDGSAAQPFRKGAGTVAVTVGVGGRSLSTVNGADTEGAYFASIMGSTTPGAGYGFVKVAVYQDHLDLQTALSGTFADSFGIFGKPSADFTSGPGTPVAGETVTFAATAMGGAAPYSFAWDFGDGGTSSGQAAEHAYTSAGSYPVTLTVTDVGGLTAIAQMSITVVPPLSADFSAFPSSPLAGNSVTLSAVASGGTGPYTFAWDFGDGTTDSGSSVTHTFASAGSYIVTLVLTDLGGATAVVTKLIDVS